MKRERKRESKTVYKVESLTAHACMHACVSLCVCVRYFSKENILLFFIFNFKFSDVNSFPCRFLRTEVSAKGTLQRAGTEHRQMEWNTRFTATK